MVLQRWRGRGYMLTRDCPCASVVSRMTGTIPRIIWNNGRHFMVCYTAKMISGSSKIILLLSALLGVAVLEGQGLAKSFTDEDFAAHVAALKKRLPHAGFTVVVQRPFVAIGDDAAQAARARAETGREMAVD